MIYNLFMFSHELDLLEVKINILWDVIDKFVICESTLGHSLLKKSLNFLDNYKRFEQYKDKIIYVTAKFEYSNAFYNDWAYRDFLFSKINWKDDDILVHDDLDEIVRPEKLKELIKNLSVPLTTKTKYCPFCVDLFGRDDTTSIILKANWVRDNFYKYRINANNYHTPNFYTFINNAGWHYSFLAPVENIVKKFENFAHFNEFPDRCRDKNFILKCIKEKNGWFTEEEPPSRLVELELNEENIPKYLLENQSKFPFFFYNYYKSISCFSK